MPPLPGLLVVSLPSTLPPPSRASEQTRWFAEEVHSHESSLKAYLRGSFPTVRDVDDLVQESYLRIWKARLARPIASTKSFLFQVARRAAIDVLRRKVVAATETLGDLSVLAVMDDRPNTAEALSYDEKIELLAAAFLRLPARCREIMTLRKLRGWSHREIALQLGISERTVESQITRGTKLCETCLRERGVAGFSRE